LAAGLSLCLFGGAVSLGLALPTTGCDIGGEEPSFRGPAPHVVSLRVASDVSASGVPTMSDADPEAESPAVVTTRFEILFDRYLDPRTAIRQAICIRSDASPVEGFDSCSGGIFLRPSYDPARRVVTYYQEDDSVRLAPDTLYVVTVLAPRDSGDVGIRAFDGAALEASRSFLIRTSDAPAATPTDQPPAADLALCPNDKKGIVGIFIDGGCPSCHGPLDPSRTGLVLRSRDGIEQTAYRSAKETQFGANADAPAVNPPRFGANMANIAPGDPGSSYLMYKILAATPVDPDTLADGETDRLLGGIVVGAPMPIDAEPMSEAQVLKLSDWIGRGAVCAPTDP